MVFTGERDVIAALAASRSAVVVTSTAERVASVLRENVTEGRLRAGTRLPEAGLAQALGVSRNTVREALSQLVAERLLVREAHRGVFVAIPGPDAVRDVYRARRLLEPAVLRSSEGARQGSGVEVAVLERLRAAVREGRAAAARGDGDAVGSANQHFHLALVGLSGSERLQAQGELLLAESRLIFYRMPLTQAFHEPYLERNGRIAEMVGAGDRGRAADELEGYLQDAEDEIMAAFET